MINNTLIQKLDLIPTGGAKLSPNSNKLKAYKENLLPFSSIQIETIIGLLLGDASLQTLNKEGRSPTFRIKFEWGSASIDYLNHVYNTFDAYCISQPHRKERISPKGNLVINYGFQTLSHKNLVFLSEIFVYKPQKTVNLALLESLITSRSLAYWFMDDGGKLDYNPYTKNRSLVLNTQSFSKIETEGLALLLTNKFKLKTEIRSNKGKWVIVVHHDSYPLFYNSINPYMHESMKYKLFKI